VPTYDYACSLCGHRFEHFASMTSPALLRCPACDKDGLQRLIGAGAGILFKGSGFYETDYKRPAATKEGSKPDSSKADAGKADAGKTDASRPSGAPKADAPASTPSPAPASRDVPKPAPKGPRPA
jgi:putative FmdB family regulatory protein